VACTAEDLTEWPLKLQHEGVRFSRVHFHLRLFGRCQHMHQAEELHGESFLFESELSATNQRRLRWLFLSQALSDDSL